MPGFLWQVTLSENLYYNKQMDQIRWYDKDSELSKVFAVIQKLDVTLQDKLAQEILQIIMCELKLDLDEEINRVTKNYTYKCQRWYDKNIDLSSSFEIIKSLDDRKRKEVTNKIIESVLYFYLDSENEV